MAPFHISNARIWYVSFPVLQKQRQSFTFLKENMHRNEGSGINEKKAGGGALFDPTVPVFSWSIVHIRHGAVWWTRQEKGTVFESRRRLFGKKWQWVGSSGDRKNNSELSRFWETTCPSKASRLSWRRSQAKKLGIFLKRSRGGRRDGKPYQKSSVLGIRAAVQRPPRPDIDYRWRWALSGCEPDPRLDDFLKHVAKEGELQNASYST